MGVWVIGLGVVSRRQKFGKAGVNHQKRDD